MKKKHTNLLYKKTSPFFQPSTRLSHSISFFPDVITPLLFPKDSNFPKPLNLSGRDTGVGSECFLFSCFLS